jgi:hypothetical protein
MLFLAVASRPPPAAIVCCRRHLGHFNSWKVLTARVTSQPSLKRSYLSLMRIPPSLSSSAVVK